MKLKSDLITAEGSQSLFENLWIHSSLFQSFPKSQILELAEFFKILSFEPGTYLIRKDEPIEWFGIICEGSAVLLGETNNALGKFELGDMISYAEISGIEKSGKHINDILGLSRGFIAIISLTDLKVMKTRKPSIVFFEKIL